GAAGIGRVGEARGDGSRTRPYRPPPAAQPDLRLRRRERMTTTARWREGLAGERNMLKHRLEDWEMSNLSPRASTARPRARRSPSSWIAWIRSSTCWRTD